MYTVLRITGIADQLNKLLGVLKVHNPDLSPDINKRKDLVCNLSKNPSVEHWAEVADALEKVSEAISEAEIGDISLLVDTMFDLKKLPNGGVAVDTLSVSQIALAAMASIGADFEATIYRPVTDEEA